jgi:hypothetical protein
VVESCARGSVAISKRMLRNSDPPSTRISVKAMTMPCVENGDESETSLGFFVFPSKGWREIR